MEKFKLYLANISNNVHQKRMEELLSWVHTTFPELDTKIAWNQPMFTHHATFVIGFSISLKHIAVSPEMQGIAAFSNEIKEAGYSQGSNIFRIKWNDEIAYPLLERMIQFNLEDKRNCHTFWRKA